MKRKVGTLTKANGGVYKDIRNRTYIVNKNEKKAYLLEDKEEKRYILYQNRLLLVLFSGALFTYFINWKVGVAIGLVVAVCIELYFRFVIKNKLLDFEYEEILDVDNKNNIFAKYSKGKKIGALVVHAVLAACLIINFFQTIYIIPMSEWGNKQIYVVIGSAAILLVCIYNLTKIFAVLGEEPEDK